MTAGRVVAPVAIAALLVAVLVAGACGGRVAGECPPGCAASTGPDAR